MSINHSLMKFNKLFFAMDSHMQEMNKVCEPCCLRFRDMGIIHFDTIVWHFCDCFQQIGTRAHGSTVSFLLSPAIAQYCSAHYSFVFQSVTLTSFVLYGMRHSYLSINVMLPKKCLHINRNKLQHFLCSFSLLTCICLRAGGLLLKFPLTVDVITRTRNT